MMRAFLPRTVLNRSGRAAAAAAAAVTPPHFSSSSSSCTGKPENPDLASLADSLFANAPSRPSAAAAAAASAAATTTATTTTNLSTPVCIIGSGPAAWTAAIYTSRAGLDPVVLEGYMANGVAVGGQLTTTTDVENYPGFPLGVQGPDLCKLFRDHGMAFGATVVSETVVNVDVPTKKKMATTAPRRHLVRTDQGTEVLCDALIIATGATARRLHFPGADAFWTRGISACAVCDGGLPLFRGKTLVVVGGGDTAMEEALFLTRFAEKVVIVHRRQALRASKIMEERAQAHPKIEWRLGAEVVRALGEDGGDGNGNDHDDNDNQVLLGSVELSTGEMLPCGGLFFGIGHDPATAFLRGSDVELDADGYVVVPPGKTGTSVEGVFACGDVMDKEWRQAVTAAGTGCMAALEAERWLAEVEGL
jgi:thioredoxin reductase (NADPH)